MTRAVPPPAVPGPPPVLEARDVSVRFGGLAALDTVDLVVPERSLIGLVGPNGAGKTTLFNVFSGLQRPSGGEVLMRGTRVTGMSPSRRARAGLARTFQRSELFPELTVRQHLVLAYRARWRRPRLVADVLGLGRLERDAAERDTVERLVQNLRLEDVADELATALPLGLGRLVEVGRALASNPAVVLLDEPSAGLDPDETAHLADALARARADHGVAMLLVEHDIDFVLGLSEFVHVLDFGVMIARGSPESIRADPGVQAAYLGTEIRT